jgi:hypothetical protein
VALLLASRAPPVKDDASVISGCTLTSAAQRVDPLASDIAHDGATATRERYTIKPTDGEVARVWLFDAPPARRDAGSPIEVFLDDSLQPTELPTVIAKHCAMRFSSRSIEGNLLRVLAAAIATRRSRRHR